MERQDASIKKMAKALRDGAKMLDAACPICNNPIFQYKSGEKACVACGRRVIFEGEAPQKGNEGGHARGADLAPKGGAKRDPRPVQPNGEPQPLPSVLTSLKERCAEKLTSLVTKLGQIDDENELSVLYTNILRVLDILKQVSLL